MHHTFHFNRLFLTVIIAFTVCSAAGTSGFSAGVHLMAGVRYDDMRMCVSTPAGVKGGPVGDVMFDLRRRLNERSAVALNLPVMRPLLFAAAFQMLQFEPALTYEYRFGSGQRRAVAGPGIGMSFHYGPDFNSNLENRGEDFFAAGPIVNLLMGIEFEKSPASRTIAGLRLFYSPLFSPQRRPGTVLGAALEGHLGF
jgi:hypothetical protein